MQYLIDGYNLLHAMGLLQGRAGPRGLEKARNRLLGLLRWTHGNEADKVTVVFDAAAAPPGATAEQDFGGIRVCFAVEQEQADDLIELLIHQASSPRNLTVVSDDNRIKQATRRRHCISLGCADYLNWLDGQRRRKQSPLTKAPVKPEGVSRSETQHWLQVFAELEHDPDVKELFDPHGFLESER